jgi:asparagine synthase (glutamine-hydrolysing)
LITQQTSVLEVSAERGIEGAWSHRAEVPGDCTVVFDGWLADRAELAAQLELDGDPDPAELILEAYRRWSTSAFPRLRGGFALVVWDERERVVYALRDPVGIHSLFRASGGGRLLVASSVDDLVAHPLVSNDLNREALAAWVGMLPPIADETAFEAVRRIPHAHIWEVHTDADRLVKYWDPAPPEPVAWVTEEELEQFDFLLERAVSRCLALGKPGIYLSGGLDSVAIAAVATDLGSRMSMQPLALSVAFPGDADELDVQTSVARTLGVPQVVEPLEGPQGVLGAALAVSAEWSVPPQGPWLPA